MKKILLLISIILFLPFCFSFKGDRAIDSKDIQQKEIVGTWAMCKRKSGDHFITGNVCNIFNFSADGTGALLLGDSPGQLICNFKWKIDGEKISFSFASEEDEESSIIDSNTEYSLLRYKKEELEYFEIVSNQGNSI